MAALIVLVVIFLGYMAHIGSGVQKDGAEYADASVIAITSHWDAKALTQRATPELLAQVRPEDVNSMFDWFATLGPLIDYEGSKLTNWTQSTSVGGGAVISAEFSGVAKYQEGSATIVVAIKKQNGTWRIAGFHVNSSKLIENKVGQRS